MRQATEEDLGLDALSYTERRKITAAKVMRKALTALVVIGMTPGEIETAFKRALEYCISVRNEKRRAKEAEQEREAA